MLICDEYLIPASLDEAFDAMARNRGRYRIIAGATDTLPWAREGRAGDVEVPVLIDVAKIPELNERRVDGARARLGAAVPIQRFLDDPALVKALPVMPLCAIWFADDQIRESATIGGNVVNASPAADTTPPLIAHGARVRLAAKRNGSVLRREMAIEEFLQGPGKTALESDELLVGLDCEALPGYGASFEKVGHRRSLVISVVCLAALVKMDASLQHIEDVRLAIGGIGPVPQRLAKVESFLRGGALTADRLEQAAEMPVALVASRSRQDYRREVVKGFMLRALMTAVRNAGGASALSPELEAAYA
jgi:xanthine dehydrogenase FAD-binding subunit